MNAFEKWFDAQELSTDKYALREAWLACAASAELAKHRTTMPDEWMAEAAHWVVHQCNLCDFAPEECLSCQTVRSSMAAKVEAELAKAWEAGKTDAADLVSEKGYGGLALFIRALQPPGGKAK